MTSGRWIAIALAVSLTVNVFIVGAVVGAFGARARVDSHRPAPAGNPLMRAGDRLPPDQAQAYRVKLRQQGAQARPFLQAAREARIEAADAIAREPFDQAAASAALAKSRAAESAAREKLEQAVVEFAASLPPDQRRDLAQGLRQPPRPPGGGRGGRRGGPGMGGPGGPGMGFGDAGRGPDGPPPYEGRPEGK